MSKAKGATVLQDPPTQKAGNEGKLPCEGVNKPA